MRIVYHLGAHCTDEEKILRCLLKNRDRLSAARYRALLRDTVMELKGAPASDDTQAMVLDAIMDEDEAERLILSHDSFMAYPQWVLRGTLYPGAAERLRALTRIFPQIEAEFHLAIRNPATFLPCLFQKQKGKTYAEFIEGTDPMLLRWSELVARIREKNPDVPLTVWCDEDTPLLWPEILRAVAGHPAGMELEGADDFLATLMSADGMARMRDYMAQTPPRTDAQRRRIVSAFLDKFALPDQIEMELDLPGWTEDYVETLSAGYDRDVARIAQMPGVRLLAP
jgi:hypothetical protein